ncbi:MAG: hypothetical protein IJ896_09645 [Fibrobacter sp.]|nr:hypothetical protein [Fibrobacter sp.]
MKKLLNIQEIKQSPWPGRFTEAFGENLVSAFLYGDCLEEGFSALEAPWMVAFILKDASATEISKLKSWSEKARREGLEFAYIFSSTEILTSLETFPLEFLEMSRRNQVLCGISPLEGFTPNREALAAQCLREWKAFLFHKRLDAKPKAEEYLQELSPLLSGLYYLEIGTYPESRLQVQSVFPELKSAENRLESLQKVFDQVCSTPNL